MWERIIKALRAKGYTGEETPEAVAAWCKENEIEFSDSDGKPVDVAAAFKQKSAKPKANVIIDDDAGDTDDSQVDPEVAEFRRWKKAQADEVRGTKAGTVGQGHAAPGVISQKTRRIDLSKKRYEAEIARAKTAPLGIRKDPVWASAEQAEEFAAPIRLYIAKRMGIDNYEFRDHDLQIAGKTWQTNINTGAGYLVAPEFAAQVVWLTEQYGTSTKLANVVSMSSNERRQPRQTGIPAMAAISEAGTYPESDASLDLLTLNAKKAGRIFNYTVEMFDDAAVSVADLIARNAAEAAALFIDQCYFIGDGTTTYNGIKGLTSGLVSGAYINASGGSWSAITRGDLWKLSGSVQNVANGRCAFVCSRQFFHQVILQLAQNQAKNSLGDGIMATWTPQSEQGGGPGGMLNGYPVYFDQSSLPQATAATSKCLYFGDFTGGSMIGLRKMLEIQTSTEAGFTTDTIKVKASTRFDCNIHGDGRGSTFGPIVALVTT